MFLSNPGKCKGSGDCVDACPTDAIRVEDGKAKSCITCGKCERVCPNRAIFKNKFGGYVVDRTKCNLCGMCQKVCPVDMIRVKDGKIMGLCSNCGVCVPACQEGARMAPPSKPVQMEKEQVNRFSVSTDHENCIECGRCAYFCPTNSIKFSYIEPGVCTKCDLCRDVCPRDAIGPIEEGGQYQIDTAKCAVCYKCLIECPNDAIVAQHGVLEIQHPEYDVENDTKMISCLNCKVCVDACPTDGLKVEGKSIRFDPDYCLLCKGDEDACAADFDHAPCVTACPQGILEFVPDSKITLEGYCVSCGGCIAQCKYDARKFANTVWNGEIKPQCIKCGICVEVCPKGALSIADGEVKVNFDECVLCEKCAIHCPVNAIPKTSPLKMKITNGYSMINNNLCVGCGKCVDACVFKAISSDEDGNLVIDNNRCIYCGACRTACPARAIKIQRDFEATI